jgi:hypothetical protein
MKNSGDLDKELAIVIGSTTLAGGFMMCALALWSDRGSLSPSYILGLLWVAVVVVSFFRTKQPDRTLARSNFCAIIALSAVIVVIITSLPYSACYEPALPCLLPFLWQILTLTLQRFGNGGMLSQLSIKVVNASFGSLAAFHIWTRSLGEIAKAGGVHGLLGCIMLLPLCFWLLMRSMSRENALPPEAEVELLEAPYTDAPLDVLGAEMRELQELQETPPDDLLALAADAPCDLDLEASRADISDILDGGELIPPARVNFLSRSDSDNSLYSSIYARAFVSEPLDSISMVSTSAHSSTSASSAISSEPEFA